MDHGPRSQKAPPAVTDNIAPCPLSLTQSVGTGFVRRRIFSGITFASIAAEAEGVELVGLTVDLDLPEMGASGTAADDYAGCVRAFDVTPEGFGSGSGHWPCETREAAIESFKRIATLVGSLVEPWFQSIVTLSQAAEFFTTEGRIGTPKLFYEDGNFEQALLALDEREKWLSRPMPWETKEWKVDQLAEVHALRQKWKAERDRRSK